jgi:hypothetical protein
MTSSTASHGNALAGIPTKAADDAQPAVARYIRIELVYDRGCTLVEWVFTAVSFWRLDEAEHPA